MFQFSRRMTFILLTVLSAASVSAFGTSWRGSKAFRIPKRSTSSTLAEQKITKQTELREDNQLLSSFSKNPWDAYVSTLQLVLEGVVPVNKKSQKKEDYAPAIEFLFSNSVPNGVPEPPALTAAAVDGQHAFRSRMEEQRRTFQTITKLNDAQFQYAVRVLTYMGDHCAKRGLAVPLMVAWGKLRQAGMIPRENCISTYMYALSLDEETELLSGDVASFHDLLFQPSENTVCLRIKGFVGQGRAAEAERLLESELSDEWRLLRSFSPIFEYYCRMGEFNSALRLYHQMQSSPRVYFDPETYALLISSLAESGCFRLDAEEIELSTTGPELFNKLAQDMADDILEINNSSAKMIADSFLVGFPETRGNLDVSCHDVAAPDEVVLSRVTVDSKTALCPRTGAKLQLFQLTEGHREHVHDTLLEMARLQYEEFKVKLTAKFKDRMEVMADGEFAQEQIAKFSQWLDEREGEPFTAIVDGPNIGYFGHGSIKYSQIKHVIDHLESMNERPLVIMPQKYAQPKFHSSIGWMQTLDEKELAVLHSLNDTGKIYEVPSKCLDDYYWMLASVSNQTTARNNGQDLLVPLSEMDGRFPGIRPMLVTNDQMRDHKLDLLDARMFRRWCSCHIVNYNFTDLYVDEWEERSVEFFAADFFSREIQGNPSYGGSLAWHFPVSEWEEHERFCIRIPV